ncbi:hypothetical protein FRB97_003808 [Tulasnella sp. 331]|nr:hypothetical protein FRB97_003808 [Tulasnella sp. 331]
MDASANANGMVLAQILAQLESLQLSQAALQSKIDALTTPTSPMSSRIATPPKRTLGLPIPGRSDSPSTLVPSASAFPPSSLSTSPPIHSMLQQTSAIASNVATLDVAGAEKDREKRLYPQRVIITTYPDQSGIKPVPLQWGAPSPEERGPVVCSRNPTSIKLRNAIGAHSGSYSIYRALAIAIGTLDPMHKPNYTMTEPPVLIPPQPSWSDPKKIVSFDPWGHMAAQAFREQLDAGLDVRPSIAITKAHIKLSELDHATATGALKVDGKIVLESLPLKDEHGNPMAGSPGIELVTSKAAVEPVWHLPGVAERFGISEGLLRRALFEDTGGMYPELITRPDIKVFLPPIGGLTAYIFGPPAYLSDETKELTVRVHDECNGSDVFGSDICTCKPYLVFAIEEAVRCAQRGGVGLVVYFRKEGRALGEVTKYLVYNLRKRGGDRADTYFKSTELIAGVKDMRFQALMPDVLHWLGIKKIHNMVSMSDMKYNAIVESGIPILKRYDIPDHLIPPDSRVEIDAKIAAGYFTSGKKITQEELRSTVAASGKSIWVGHARLILPRKLSSTTSSHNESSVKIIGGASRVQYEYRLGGEQHQIRGSLEKDYGSALTRAVGRAWNGRGCLWWDGAETRLTSKGWADGRERYFKEATALLRALDAISKSPTSTDAPHHLQLLTAVFSSKEVDSVGIASFLIGRGFYSDLGSAIQRIPLNNKSNPSIPLVATLVTLPFAVFPITSAVYLTSFVDLLWHIFTVPLLPNRFPLASLTELSKQLPFSSLHIISPAIFTDPTVSLTSRVHLLANLVAFVNPRLAKLSATAFSAFLQGIAAILESLPPQALDPPSKGVQETSWAMQDDSDMSDVEVAPKPAQIRTPPMISPPLDARTVSRLQSLVSPAQIDALLTLTSKQPSTRPSLFRVLLSLCTAWPSKKDKVLSSLVFPQMGSLLIKELWRGWVRPSPLGKDVRQALEIARDQRCLEVWTPLLLLVDMYTHALLTMGDDEFFSIATRSNAPRNPLTLDELTAFSKQLMNITFPLYWNEDQLNVKEDCIPGTTIRWEPVREKLTKCLKAIHTRDSRRKFTHKDHWLMTSHIDIQSFCEAAIFEEQKLDRTSSRSLSKRQMAYISPRLGVLNNIPFAIPFSARVEIFRDFVSADMTRLDLSDPFARPKFHCVVRRGQIAKDGYDGLNSLGAQLKGRIQITFVDQFGEEERGIDGGGVFKEFLTSLSKEAFDTDRGLWLFTDQQELYPNPHAYAREPHQLNWYRFIGRVLGKALYEGILIDVAFATFFMAKWLGRQSYLDDLASLDPELYRGLIYLKHYDGNPEDLALNFTVTTDDFGVQNTINLIPDGTNIPVTRENRMQYIYLVSNYKLNAQIRLQSDAFFDGLSDIIDPKWLRMFNQQELQILVGGTEDPVDVDDLRSNTIYGGVYDESHPTIGAFWRVVRSLDQPQRCALLRFVTSCSRPPLLGFKELNPKFSIRDAGSDAARLPTASTCVNLLKSEQALRRKLLQAINSGAGFDLS